MSFRSFAPAALLTLVAIACAWPTREARAQTAAPGAGEEAFLVGQEMEDQGKGQAAISAYKAFIKDNPASPNAAKAQYRIAQILQESGELNRAFDAYQTLVTRYPDTPDFEDAVAQQVWIANRYLEGKRMSFLGMPILPGIERAQKMYESILANAPYSRYAPIAQFNLGLSFERQKMINDARKAYQTVLDKYPNSDVSDDALYQIAYIYMLAGLSGRSQDLSSLVLARETFEDFLLQYPNSEKVPQARENLASIGGNEAGDLMRIARYYDWSKNYKAAVIYYNDVIRKQPKTADAESAKTRIEELRAQVGDDTLRVGSERAESGEKLALRRRLQAQVETSALADYAGPSRRDVVPDELPVVRQPRLRTGSRDLQPVEPVLPTQ